MSIGIRRADPCTDGCLMIINSGRGLRHDRAVYGQIARAYYGEGAIPRNWKHALAKRDLIAGLADRPLAAAVR